MTNILNKQNLSSQELLILQSEVDKKGKSKTPAWLLWLFTGGIGGHRYYMGDIGYAVAMTLTLGGLGFWTLIDAFLINGAIDKKNEEVEREVMVMLGMNK
ncbi:TM2 domain-containing protein [Mammaliicoccus sciuri]|uniref:TM2 domain-containing protein n=1 Tax=Mammaliicoccus sciuri TaxID=1296 RepID=UPI002B25E778|nr:TM2 domain-containing protein [Mammaliicoccus sciuri]WQL34328.1 TM2 domain-containing protein [Mammaliicoccus sciuri]WQL61267.1 TM2 domain-containing protein [Mammaliicoccus sciuri]